MSSRSKRLSVLVFAIGFSVLSAIAPRASAQTSAATINGSVHDESGAPIPNVDVIVTNQGTGVKTTVTTNSAGDFTVSGLAVGTYTVAASKQGFQPFQTAGDFLGAAQTLTVNAVLKIGQVSSEVTVAASAAQVQLSTSEVSNVVSQEQVANLPLNGRNYQGLAALMPGVVNVNVGTELGTGGRQTRNAMAINGMGTAATLYTLDGIWNMNTGNMAQTTILPNPDQVQEVRTYQNNFSPKDSLMGASVVMVTTKSGTREFHGTLFEYLRNDALDARNFFSPSVPALKQNIFGGNVGGPVLFPGYNKNRDKTFFFLSMQGVVRNQASVNLGASPTADMRAGRFDYPIIDPVTGNPFPQIGGQWVIPASRINQNSVALLNALAPLPNYSSGFLNYINLNPTTLREIDSQIKVDHNFNSKWRLMGDYFDTHQFLDYAYDPSIGDNGSPFPSNRENDLTRNKLARLELTGTITPNMVNQISVGTNIYVLDLELAGKWQLSDVPAYQSILPFNGFLSNKLPEIQFAGGWSEIGAPAGRPLPHAADLENAFADDWSWSHGKHFIEAGFNLVKETKRQLTNAQSNGRWSFDGRFTGDSIADFLLGNSANFYQQSSSRLPYVHGTIASPYVVDHWKATRRLTINAGMRFEFMPEPHAQTGYETLFDPSRFDPAKVPIVNPDGTITPTPNYDPSNGLIRNGLNGIPNNFTNQHQWYFNPSVGFAWDVLGNGKTSLRGGYGITHSRVFTGSDCSKDCASNYPDITSLTLENASFPNPIGTGAVAPLGAPSLNSMDLNQQAAQVQSFSLTVEHEFPANWFVSIGGAGNIGRHVPSQYDRNQPYPISGFDFDPAINSGTFPYLRPPYPGWATITTDVSTTNLWWSGLLASVRHQVGKGLFLSASYTWSHALSDTRGNELFQNNNSTQDIYHPRADYGNSDFNVGQVFAFSYVWSLPFFANSTGLTHTFLGGWRYTGTTTIQSGFSLDPTLSVSEPGLAIRPNIVPGVSLQGPKTVAEWFNTAAFTQAPPGFFGNAGNGIITGPGLVNFDMGFYKDFHLTERHVIQFRSEFFNIFNHTNFNEVDTAYGDGSFGQVVGAADPRIIEFALRWQF
jgi:hypothetical protein